MKKFFIFLIGFLFFNQLVYSQTIGSCTASGATAKSAGGFTDFDDADNNYSDGTQNFSPDHSSTTVTYSLVNSGTTGAIGFDISHKSTPSGCIDNSLRSAVLYPVTSGCAAASAINPTDGANNSTYYNPEFLNLTPNTKYILVITTQSSSSCKVAKQYTTYYSAPKATPPPTPATCDCASPTCASELIADVKKPTFSSCNSYDGSEANPSTITSFYTIKTNNNGTLGFLQQVGYDSLSCDTRVDSAIWKASQASRKFYLYETITDCGANAITPDVANAGNSSTMNPEWMNLKPNTEYYLKITIDITGCGIRQTCLDYYYPPVPGCGTLGFFGYLKTSKTTPMPPSFSNCEDEDYYLKADSKTDAGQYIAPGFTIESTGNINISNVKVKEGLTGSFQDAGTLKILSYCFPDQEYQIKLTGSGSGSINILDHATGAIVKTVTFASGTTITLPANTIKGTAIFSGPGITNETRGYAVFNPKKAGNGTHTITYSWNNGTKDCGTTTQQVEVSGCPEPEPPCGTCAVPDCPIAHVPTFADRSDGYSGGPDANCKTYATDIDDITYVTHHLVTIPANGAIGLVQQLNLNTPGCETRKVSLKATNANGECTGGEILANEPNKNGLSSKFNPEWYGLTPGDKYVVIIETTLPAGCKNDRGCLVSYDIPNPPPVPRPCAMQNGGTSTCDCVFTDSGDSIADYSSDEDLTYTICPDDTAKKSQITFRVLDLLDLKDVLTIHDGKSLSDPQLFKEYKTSTLPTAPVKASIGNTSGCLTIHYESDGAGESAGWVADVSCYQSCKTPVAAETTTEFGTQKIIKACLDATITFDGSTSTANAGGGISSYTWDFGDGSAPVTNSTPTSPHVYSKPGRYFPTLVVTNADGCISTNAITTQVLIGTKPNFNGTLGGTACLNEQFCTDGVVTWPIESPVNIIDPPPVTDIPVENAVVKIPIVIKGYGVGQKITKATDLLSICANMEHSATDDIIVTLISPTGQKVVLHNRGGEATVLGFPTMGGAALAGACSWPPSSATAVARGQGLDYCFKPSAAETWKTTADAGFAAAGSPPCYQLPAGDYLPIDQFSKLIGSDINGTWILQVEDVYKNDDGTVFSWTLNLDPSLLPNSAPIEPVLDSQTWSAVTGSDIVSQAGKKVCIVPTDMTHTDYKYTVKDDYGCTFDTTITLTITNNCNCPKLVITNPDTICASSKIDITIPAITAGSLLAGGTYTYWMDSLSVDSLPDAKALSKSGIYYIKLANADCFEIKPVEINLIASPEITVAKLKNQNCPAIDNGEVTLNATGGSGTTNWQYSKDNRGTFGPINTFSGLAPGAYVFSVKDDITECITDTVVSILPAPVFKVYGPDTVCSGTIATLSAVGVKKFTWETQAPSRDSVYTKLINGVTVISVKDSCNASTPILKTINVFANPTVVIPGDTNLTACLGDSTKLLANVTGGSSPFVFTWSPMATLTDIAYLGRASSATSINAVEKIYTYKVTAMDNCRNSDSKNINITVKPLPNVEIYSKDAVCQNDTLIIYNTKHNSTMVKYEWKFGSKTDNGIGKSIQTFANSGIYYPFLKVTDVNGCVNSVTDTFEVVKNPIPIITPSATEKSIFNPIIVFDGTDSHDNIKTYLWNFAELGTDTNERSTFTFPDTGVYPIHLAVKNANVVKGKTYYCYDSTQISITIKDELALFIPNAFSPNNDGKNDEFSPKGFGFTKYEMRIFDRWGNEVFLSKDIEKTWNGGVNGSDTKANEDVYVYLITVEPVNKKGKERVFTGHVTLIR